MGETGDRGAIINRRDRTIEAFVGIPIEEIRRTPVDEIQQRLNPNQKYSTHHNQNMLSHEEVEAVFDRAIGVNNVMRIGNYLREIYRRIFKS